MTIARIDGEIPLTLPRLPRLRPNLLSAIGAV